MKCFHHNDLDGRCAAAIVRKAYPACEFIEMDYAKALDVNTIEPGEMVYIVDFSFKPDVMSALCARTQGRVVWIDHHKTILENLYAEFFSVPGVRSTSQAACVLTWEFLFPQVPVPYGVRLIGDKDAWSFTDWRSDNFCIGIEAEDARPQSGFWALVFQSEAQFIVDSVERGGEIRRYREWFCERYCETNGFETEFEGHKAFAVGLYMFGSQAFGRRVEQYPLLIAFEFNGSKWVIGLYSKTLDVSEIAKKQGGGGHKGAAGFTAVELPFAGANGERPPR